MHLFRFTVASTIFLKLHKEFILEIFARAIRYENETLAILCKTTSLRQVSQKRGVTDLESQFHNFSKLVIKMSTLSMVTEQKVNIFHQQSEMGEEGIKIFIRKFAKF